MSLDYLKKLAKNAKKQLPLFVAQHQQPFTLADCQEFIARLAGYSSWQSAQKHAQKTARSVDDPLLAFYGYDWSKISVDEFLDFADQDRCRVNIHTSTTRNAIPIVRAFNEDQFRIERGVMLVNVAGEEGGKVLDQIFDDSMLRQPFAMTSFSRLSNRIGMTINPLDKMSTEECVSLFTALIHPVCSSKQLTCSQDALRLTLTGLSSGEALDIPTVREAVNRVICLANGGWSKGDEDFYATFPDEERHEDAHTFFAEYDEKIPLLLRPLDALLTRLSVPGLAKTLSPAWCELDGEWREEFMEIGEDGWLHTPVNGLQIVNVEFGGKELDYLGGALVIAKVLFAQRFNRYPSLLSGAPQLDIVFMQS